MSNWEAMRLTSRAIRKSCICFSTLPLQLAQRESPNQIGIRIWRAVWPQRRRSPLDLEAPKVSLGYTTCTLGASDLSIIKNPFWSAEDALSRNIAYSRLYRGVSFLPEYLPYHGKRNSRRRHSDLHVSYQSNIVRRLPPACPLINPY